MAALLIPEGRGIKVLLSTELAIKFLRYLATDNWLSSSRICLAMSDACEVYILEASSTLGILFFDL